jgi:hypothetical protein
VQFVFQSLAWGFLLVLLPLLIHLINLVRHRRTEWAAMEFLLESYRKHRRWVWLKQALLIASRMLAVAIVVAMLAQWVSGSRWLSMVSQSTTHHYFIIDDSASMGDMASGGSAYQAALGAVQTIVSAAPSREGNHLISVLRASKASKANDPTSKGQNGSLTLEPTSGTPVVSKSADSVADLLARSIPSDPTRLLDKLMGTQPSAMDCALSDSVTLLGPVMQQSPSEKAVVYILSDFRRKDWQNATLLKQQIQSLPNSDLELQMIDCMPARHENLTITSVSPQQEVLVAGVPSLINITVRNNGTAPARNISVRVNAIDYGDKQLEQKPGEAYSGLSTELPLLLIDRIEPGESVTRHTQVLFPRSGSHVITAQLPPDSLQADNRANCVLDLQEGLQVLLIDGDAAGKHSFYFESALSPGGTTKTGLVLTREGPEYLRDADPEALNRFACVIMQAVPGLDMRAVENLHGYVAGGGGLAIFFGELMTAAEYARYNASLTKIPSVSEVKTPLMPFSLKGPAELARSAEDTAPDVIADNHPIFESLLKLSNSPFQGVRMQRYVELDESLFAESATESREAARTKTWKPVLTMRNKRPLLIDHSVGEGRVLFGLTAFDRQWTNWHLDPTFVVAALKTVGYLSSFRGMETAKQVGAPMRWDFSSQEMLPEIEVLCPSQPGSTIRTLLRVNARPSGENSLSAFVDPDSEQGNEESFRSILNAGVFEWWGTSTQGERLVRNLARNVSPLEGELDKIGATDLTLSLDGVRYSYKNADSVGSSLALAGFANRNMLLMCLLLGLLLFEQWLAWSASYHLPSK